MNEFTEETKKKVLKKIKNLFELSSSDSPNESALALQKARELMNKYGIKETDFVMSNIHEKRVFACYGQRPPNYLVVLAKAISEVFECEHFHEISWDCEKNKWNQDLVFIGFGPNQEICSYVFDTVAVKLKKSRKNYLNSIRGTAYSVARADAYAVGWVYAVAKTATELLPKKEQANTGIGLIPVNMVKQYVEDMNMRTTKAKGHLRSKADEDAGYKDGLEVQLNKGVYHEKSALRIH